MAQSDYRAGSIVTNSGDTVHGFIDYKADYKLYSLCQFKTTNSDRVRKYHAWDIKGYQFDKEQRIFYSDSVTVDGNYELLFLEVVLEGKLNLYKYTDKDLINYFFIKRSGESKVSYIPFKRYYEKLLIDNYYQRIIPHKTTNHIDTLKKFMGDAPSIYPLIEKIVEPTEYNLIKLIKLYHDKICYTGICITHEKKKYPLRLFVTPGFYYSFNKIINYTDNNLYGGFTTSIGILNSNERLFLKTGLFVTKNNSSYQTNKSYFYNIPLQLEYRFPLKTIQPVIACGFYLNSIYVLPPLALTTGINIALSKKIALTLAPEFYFIPEGDIQVVPIFFNVFGGLQIKL